MALKGALLGPDSSLRVYTLDKGARSEAFSIKQFYVKQYRPTYVYC